MEEQLSSSNADKSYNQSFDVTKNLLNQTILKSKLPVENNNCLVQIPNKLDDKNAATEINDCQLNDAIKRSSKTSLLNIEEASVDRLANFMGHHKDIHKSIYRMSISVAEIRCVSKLLMAAVGDDDEDEGENIEHNTDNLKDHIDNPENNIDDLEVTAGNSKSEETLFEDSKNSSSSSNRKRRSSEY